MNKPVRGSVLDRWTDENLFRRLPRHDLDDACQIV